MWSAPLRKLDGFQSWVEIREMKKLLTSWNPPPVRGAVGLLQPNDALIPIDRVADGPRGLEDVRVDALVALPRGGGPRYPSAGASHELSQMSNVSLRLKIQIFGIPHPAFLQ